jgi:rod shape-determining protein MreD
MKKLIGACIGIAAAFALQVALSLWFPWLGGRLDLLLLPVVYYAVGGSQELAMVSGAAAGLLQDQWFGGLPYGRNAFRKILIGYLVGAVGRRFALEATWTYGIAVVAASLADHAIGVALGAAIGLPIADPWSVLVLERALATALLGIFLVLAVKRFARARERRLADRSRRFQKRSRAAR